MLQNTQALVRDEQKAAHTKTPPISRETGGVYTIFIICLVAARLPSL
jgi:hypothetical protein